MVKSRLSREYEVGVETFIEFGLRHGNGSNSIRCPCLKCGNRISKDVSIVRDHLYVNGIDQSYKLWFWHGVDLATHNVNYNSDPVLNENYEDQYDLFNIIDMILVHQISLTLCLTMLKSHYTLDVKDLQSCQHL